MRERMRISKGVSSTTAAILIIIIVVIGVAAGITLLYTNNASTTSSTSGGNGSQTTSATAGSSGVTTTSSSTSTLTSSSSSTSSTTTSATTTTSSSTTNASQGQFVKYTLLLNNNTLRSGNVVPPSLGGATFEYLTADSANGYVYVTTGSDVVSMIDGQSEQMVKSISLGGALNVYGILYDPANKYVYVAVFNASAPNGDAGVLSTIDTSTNTVIANINTYNGPYKSPINIALDSSNGYLYATTFSSNVSVIDGNTNSFVTNIPISGSSFDAAYDPQNNNVYVTDNTANSVLVISGSTNEIIKTIAVGNYPEGITFDPLNGLIYVANLGSNYISVINGSTNSLLSSIPLPTAGCVINVEADTQNGNVYAPSCGSAVAVIDSATNAISGYIPTNNAPKEIAFNPFNNMLYVGSEDARPIALIDPSQNTFVQNVYLILNPSAVAFDSSNGKLYVGEPSTQSMSVVDTANGWATSQVYLGVSPQAIAIDPANNEIYLSYYNDGAYVLAVDANTNAAVANINLGTIGGGNLGLAFDPSNGYLYVSTGYGCGVGTCWGPGTVAVIDTKTNSLSANITVGNYASSVAFDSLNGNIYVADTVLPCHVPGACLNSTVSVIDGVTNEVTGNIPIVGDVESVWFDPSNGYVYANNGSDIITLIDGATNEVVGTLDVGQPVNNFASMNGIILLSNSNSNQIVVVNATTDKVLQTFSAGSLPAGIDGDPSTGYFYVANYGSGTISIISV